MSATAPEPSRFELVLESRAAPADAEYSLRRALKRLLRGYGLRCVHVARVAAKAASGDAL